MPTLDLSLKDLSPDELKRLVQEALGKESPPTELRISANTYQRIQAERPGMKTFVDHDYTTETFYGLRLTVA